MFSSFLSSNKPQNQFEDQNPYTHSYTSQPQQDYEPETNQNQPGNNPNQQYQGEEQEIPLLEDLDIDLEMVKSNLKSVILFKPFDHKFTEDPDMTGPVLVGFSLALALILVSYPDF